MTNIEGTILELAVKALNSLEGRNCKSVDVFARNKDDANELKGYLTNYDVEIEDYTVSTGYFLKVSKKEKK